MGSLKKRYPLNAKAHQKQIVIQSLPKNMFLFDWTILMPPPLEKFKLKENVNIVSIHVPIIYRESLDIGYQFVRNILVMAYLQDFDRWNLLLADDPSGTLNLSDTLDEVENYVGFTIDRNRIEYFQACDKNLGIKRNTMVSLTPLDTQLIINWDDDDIYMPQYLSSAIDFCIKNPFQVGIFAGKRHQYNLAVQHCIRWHRKYSNGAAYYVFRRDMFTKFPFIKYNTTRLQGEERDVIKAIRHFVNRAWSNQDTVCKECDANYVRLRYNANLTHGGGQGWKQDLNTQRIHGGSFIEDHDLAWLFERLPECLHSFYRDLVERIQND